MLMSINTFYNCTSDSYDWVQLIQRRLRAKETNFYKKADYVLKRVLEKLKLINTVYFFNLAPNCIPLFGLANGLIRPIKGSRYV
jgi:hypothetical protein